MNIKITKNRLNHIKDEKLKSTLLELRTLNLRIITVQLVIGEIEYWITNLDKKNFKYQDIAISYRLRWEIEVSFKSLKSLLKVENISRYSKIAVQQDLFSQILAYNNIINDIKKYFIKQKKLKKLKIHFQKEKTWKN